jgi:hypothetical protein
MSRPGGWTFGIADIKNSKWVKKEELNLNKFSNFQP